MEQAKYRLFVGQAQSVPSDIPYYFYNVEHNYLLLFSDKDEIPGFDVVPEQILKELSPDERVWLLRAKNRVMKQYIDDNKQDITALLDRFLDVLEDEMNKQLQEKREENNAE